MTHRNSLPAPGAVLGVDFGYSETKRSSAVCRLDWNARMSLPDQSLGKLKSVDTADGAAYLTG